MKKTGRLNGGCTVPLRSSSYLDDTAFEVINI